MRTPGKLMRTVGHGIQKTAQQQMQGSLIEVKGRDRALIENHKGIIAYSTISICVRTSFGSVCLEGADLQIRKMTKECLLIVGRISSIHMDGGK